MLHKLSILALVLSLALAPLALAADTQRPPNVIVILADDLGVGDVGFGGATKIRTPAIDGLAATGVVMTQAYASANICTPSRAGLLTGRYPIRTGLAWDVVQANDDRGMPDSELTMAELFANAGYQTGMVGKWHLGSKPQFWPTRHGFRDFFGVPHSNDMPGFALYEQSQVIEDPVDQSTLTRRYTEHAIGFIEKHRDRPFFLFFSHTSPHIPLFASNAFIGRSDAGLYGDVVEELDWSVGQIVSTLEKSKLRNQTIVIFTSDNGAWFEGSGSNLRGAKGSTFDAAYRVPLALSWPGTFAGGRHVDAVTMNFDLFPTVAAAANLALPADRVIDGRDLSPMLRGQAQSAHDYLLYFDDEEIVAVRDKRWKLLHRAYYRRSIGALDKFGQLAGFAGDYPMLFDMDDPNPERYSLARDNPEVITRLGTLLQAQRQEFAPLRTRPARQTYPE